MSGNKKSVETERLRFVKTSNEREKQKCEQRTKAIEKGKQETDAEERG